MLQYGGMDHAVYVPRNACGMAAEIVSLIRQIRAECVRRARRYEMTRVRACVLGSTNARVRAVARLSRTMVRRVADEIAVKRRG